MKHPLMAIRDGQIAAWCTDLAEEAEMTILSHRKAGEGGLLADRIARLEGMRDAFLVVAEQLRKVDPR